MNNAKLVRLRCCPSPTETHGLQPGASLPAFAAIVVGNGALGLALRTGDGPRLADLVGVRCFALVLVLVLLALGGVACNDRAAPAQDAAAARDAGDSADAADLPLDCAPGVSGCTCVPVSQGASCTHTNGGLYAHQGCSASYQCCDGVFREGLASCGTCTCSETTGTSGCQSDGEERCFPSFEGAVEPISDEVRSDMTGKSWHAELACPAFADLRIVRMSHWGLDGEVHRGEMVVSASAAAAILTTFEKLYNAGFAIERMQRIDVYDGDDDASMAANNTSAFNCRAVTGSSVLSAHASGEAIDINPIQNPYVRGATVLPPAGEAYLDRGNLRMGMIGAGHVVVKAFSAIGWSWGGNFSKLKDYQHFSLSGG